MKKNYLYFEGLRGILAFVVIIHHFVLFFIPKLYARAYDVTEFNNDPYSGNNLFVTTPIHIFMNGSLAVSAFFALSGFVLSLKYLKTNNPLVLQTSIAKRYLRLVIPILGSCLFIYVLYFFGVFQNTFYPRSVAEFSFAKNLFLNNLSIFQTIKMALFDVPFLGDNTYYHVLWTMQLELFGALLLFAFLLSSHQLQYKSVYLLIVVLVLLIMNKNHLSLFFAGCFVAMNEEKIKVIFKNKFLKILLFILVIYFGGIPNVPDVLKEHTLYWYTTYFSKYIYLKFHIISCSLLLIFLVSTSSAQKILSTRILVFLGKISFSMYLVHSPIFFVIGSYFLRKTGGQINYLLLFGICSCITIAFSYIFYLLIDTKAVLFANKFSEKFVKPIIKPIN